MCACFNPRQGIELDQSRDEQINSNLKENEVPDASILTINKVGFISGCFLLKG
jgi:hypothetical protein